MSSKAHCQSAPLLGKLRFGSKLVAMNFMSSRNRKTNLIHAMGPFGYLTNQKVIEKLIPNPHLFNFQRCQVLECTNTKQCGNVVSKWKSKHSAFQNTKNLWNRCIIREVRRIFIDKFWRYFTCIWSDTCMHMSYVSINTSIRHLHACMLQIRVKYLQNLTSIQKSF